MHELEKVVDYIIIGILFTMSFVATGIAIEKFLFIRRINISSYRTKKELEIDLTSKMHILATIGSNAPYIGLLGTVLGIMLTFYNISITGLIDTFQIMRNLALALKATAIGLLVAIPTIVIYNFLLRQIKVLLLKWEILNEKSL